MNREETTSFPPSVRQLCKMCGTCVQNCPHKSIHLDLRWPGAEIWENREPHPAASLSIPALLGALYPLMLHTGGTLPELWPFTLAFPASVASVLVLFLGACLLKGASSFWRVLRPYGFVYLPLAFAGHISFQVPFILEGLKWVIGHGYGSGAPGQGFPLAQNLLIAAGSLWSLWSLRKLFRKDDWPVCLAHGALILCFGIFLIILGR